MINSHLCTVKLSRRTVPGLNNYRLDTVADHFSIPIFDRHRAGSDALATAEVFLHVLTRLKEKGVGNLAAAREFQSIELPEPKSLELREIKESEPVPAGAESALQPATSGV